MNSSNQRVGSHSSSQEIPGMHVCKGNKEAMVHILLSHCHIQAYIANRSWVQLYIELYNSSKIALDCLTLGIVSN